MAKKTGFDPREHINLHDPATLRRVMSAIISHENGAQPYTDNEINQAIHTSINDDRWKGLRDPQTLQAQRQADAQTSGGTLSSPVSSAGSGGQSGAAGQENKVAVELTLINDKTGERKQLITQGGRVATSMSWP